MSTPSNFSEIGIAIYAKEPIWSTSLVYSASLTQMVNNYTHVIAANGGYKSASINMTMRQDEIEDWLEFGLGRDITTFNEAGIPVWEGFVNDIEANIGGLNIKRGPLMDVINKLAMVYAPLDMTTYPPTVGSRTKTAYASHTASQAKYGIIENILSCSNAPDAIAANIRDTTLAESARPETTQKITIGNAGNLDITLNCLGYEAWLNVYVYNSTALWVVTGVGPLDGMLQDIINAEPNGIISHDYSHMAANALSVPAFASDDKKALYFINWLVTMGDAAYNRYTFGIYADRKAWYQPMPTDCAYIWRLKDGGTVTTPYGGIVEPWNMLPARWIFIPDFMIGRVPTSTNLRDDPRYVFIEDLTYTAPYGLSLNGSKAGRLPQILGQLGLLGMGA